MDQELDVPVAAAYFFWIAPLICAASGALVAAALLLGGMRRMDAEAAAAPLQVRLLLVPGLVALWPHLLRRPEGRQPEEDRSSIARTAAPTFASRSLLTPILAIGPLARLSPRFLPLLCEQRHMGMTCFLLALVHATLLTVWHFGDLNSLVSLRVSNPRYDSLQGFPFESLGRWQLDCNATSRTIEWMFTRHDAYRKRGRHCGPIFACMGTRSNST